MERVFSIKIKIMVYTLSYNDNSQEAYFQGGMRRLVEIHNYLRKHGVAMYFLGLQTATQHFFENRYIIPTAGLLGGKGHYLRRSLITRFAFLTYYLLASIIDGSKAVVKSGIDAIESPQEDMLTPILSFVISKITGRPMIAIVHTIPCYGHIYGRRSSLKDFDSLSKKSTNLGEIFNYLRTSGVGLLRARLSSILYFVNFYVLERSYIITVNAYIADILKKMLKNDRIDTVYPGNGVGVDTGRSMTPKAFDAIIAGGLSPEKGIYDCLYAWKNVLGVLPNAKLAIAGRAVDSKTAKEIQNCKKKLNLNSSIVLLNDITKGVDHSKLLDYISMAKVLIYPSKRDVWPLTINESIGCATPVISYDIPSFKHLYATKAVTKVPAGSVQELTSAILKLLREHVIYEQAFEATIVYAKLLTWDKVALDERRAYFQAIRQFEQSNNRFSKSSRPKHVFFN
jgi:glycosyltransferase involved in cell wall biosynthesis